MEEIGIELCNMKLGLRPRVPYVFFHADFWSDLEKQLAKLVLEGRMPAWIKQNLLFSGNPDEIIEFYRKTLQIL